MSGLAGQRLLILEDEMLVALALEDIVTRWGSRIVGPVANVATALAAIAAEPPDAALLDVNLQGERADPVADALAARGVPFVFVTGYGGLDLPARFAEAPLLSKPFEPAALKAALLKAIAARRA
jgi:DNA-binding NtrC family response regulator